MDKSGTSFLILPGLQGPPGISQALILGCIDIEGLAACGGSGLIPCSITPQILLL